MPPRRLPTITIDGKTYFVDDRLTELRNVDNPHDALRFESKSEMLIALLLKNDIDEGVETLME